MPNFCVTMSYNTAMPNLPAFDADKAVEAILYTTSRAKSGLYATLKLLYLADKIHLERYGRFIFGDWYAALPYGPVPSNSYDILKLVRNNTAQTLAPHAAKALVVDSNHGIKALREPNLDELSRSDVECLDRAIAEYSKCGFKELKRVTHDKAYDAAPRNGEIMMEAIASMLKNASELAQHVADPHPDRA